jgi:hypothetical protein
MNWPAKRGIEHIEGAVMNIARLRIRIRDKATRRTYLAFWPWEDGIALCIATGHRVLVTRAPGYAEFNDRGEAVLDSWTEPFLVVTAH